MTDHGSLVLIVVLVIALGWVSWQALAMLGQRDYHRRAYLDLVLRLHQEAASRRRPPPPPPPPTRAEKLANLAKRSDNPHERALADELLRRTP